ncbi:hypothetical protein Bpfe_016505, partial [Biomphalaria pfeifferi]
KSFDVTGPRRGGCLNVLQVSSLGEPGGAWIYDESLLMTDPRHAPDNESLRRKRTGQEGGGTVWL